MNQRLAILRRIPGQVYLLLSIIIFASASPVTRQLINLGEQHLIDGKNPVAFCNILFVGNICALLLLVSIYHHQFSWQTLKQFTFKVWLGLIGIGIFSGALAPALVFLALDLTSVNNVILIGRIEPPLTLVLSVLLLKARVNYWVGLGSVFSFLGVLIIVWLQSPEQTFNMMGGKLEIGRGELCAVLGAISVAIANILSKVSLKKVPLGIFSIIRNILGTVIFFVIAMKLYGLIHFAHIFTPFLWQWMFIYSAIIVVGGQLCWLMGLKYTSASDVSLASSFSPILGITFTYLILGEMPNKAQYIGGSVIMMGIMLTQIGVRRLNQKILINSTPKEADIRAGFKGI
ncbi:DMT family transporter [Crocosphaera sp. XPORK-15E]|uniref:DMT family transporter n=1 Tax=Crocosphaera sp. XPORK-15E TaxID=3110247 RepID=UPI002B1FF5CF|nr:DMT family transporter [Crocosphaera sp. XPORK-15E]MEA5532912.1 DMT family transporter [Crocosphaera sp. XPORK-15E]